MTQKRCFIVGAGIFNGMSIMPDENDLIIAADGGYKYLHDIGIEPDVLLGDFDSLEKVPEHDHLIRHSPVKDDTDMALAAEYGIESGCTEFYLYGGLGGRLDHSLANIQLLNGLSRRGYIVYLIGEGVILTAVTDEAICFKSECTGMISVFCLGEAARGVTEKGLKYGLDHAVMTCDRALGVSNEFTGTESMIKVEQGTLIVSWNEENGIPERERGLNK